MNVDSFLFWTLISIVALLLCVGMFNYLFPPEPWNGG